MIKKIIVVILSFAFICQASEKSDTSLLDAALKGNASEVKKLLEAGADVNVTDTKGNTPLLLVLEEAYKPRGFSGREIQLDPEHVEVVKLLLNAKNSNVNKTNELGESALTLASQRYPFLVHLLLKLGADPNQATKRKITPLMRAAMSAPVETANLLLQKEAQVNAKDDFNNTPLLLATRFRPDNDELVSLLIKAGADVNVANNRGDTPLISAAEGLKPTIVETLLSAGALAGAKNKEGETALTLVRQKKKLTRGDEYQERANAVIRLLEPAEEQSGKQAAQTAMQTALGTLFRKQ